MEKLYSIFFQQRNILFLSRSRLQGVKSRIILTGTVLINIDCLLDCLETITSRVSNQSPRPGSSNPFCHGKLS